MKKAASLLLQNVMCTASYQNSYSNASAAAEQRPSPQSPVFQQGHLKPDLGAKHIKLTLKQGGTPVVGLVFNYLTAVLFVNTCEFKLQLCSDSTKVRTYTGKMFLCIICTKHRPLHASETVTISHLLFPSFRLSSKGVTAIYIER